jgi:ubiquinone/menaquinone biosynthesis C-methylase UbiE
MNHEPTDPLQKHNQEVYKQSVKEEIDHYTALYKNEESLKTLTEKVPPSWFFVEQKFNDLICKANEGHSFLDEIAEHMQAHPGGRTLSIGSGPGALELIVAQNLAEASVKYEITCMDINPNVLALGQERAKAKGLNMKFVVQDINDLSLEANQYDVIMCHASLHHLINLEHIYYEMNRSLKDDGEVVVLDIVTRHGYLMWEETHAVVRSLWKVLPEKFRYNHTAYNEIRLDSDYENRDYTGDSMECIRSGDILPLLNEYFDCRVYVPFTSIARRFLDTMYGPNYDLSQELDRSIMEFIWQMDVHYISQNILKPETMFGIYTKRAEKQRPSKYMELGPKVDSSPSSPSPMILEVAIAELPEAGKTQFTPTELLEILHILGVYRRVRGSRFYATFKFLAKMLGV